ncbi:MAG TPA: VTT domain-containing protein [Geminicoccaceae bacterium]|nr:VTT domain-containing protein [Geminicoccaceae bacterium]
MRPIPDPAAGLPPDPSGARGNPGRGSVVLVLALLVLLTGAAAGLVFGLDASLALDALRTHHHWLLGFVAGTPILASLLFMAIYALAVTVSVPGLALLTVIGGYLFGWLEGTAYALVATTLAASAVFLVARSAIGEPLRARAGPALVRFAEAFRSNAPSYVFVLHLVPIFPYAMVIGIPAACGVRLRTFVISAFLGLLPGTLLLAYLGSGLGGVLRAGLPVSLTSLLRPDIVLSLVGLTVLALLPVAYRAWRGRAQA